MAALPLLDAVTATGPGLGKRFANLVQDHTVTIQLTGAPTAVTVNAEGSLDGADWYPLAEHVFSAEELAADGAMFHIIDKPVTFFRLNLTVLTAGTSPTVTGLYEGDELSIKKISRRGAF